MNNYDKRKIISYLMYLDANNLYGWAMIQKLPINGFKWVEKLLKFNEKLVEGYNKNSDRGYFLKVDVNYLKTLFNSHKDLLFLPKRTTKKKVKKLLCGVEDKEKYVVHIRALKQALTHDLKLKRVYRVIQFMKKHG